MTITLDGAGYRLGLIETDCIRFSSSSHYWESWAANLGDCDWEEFLIRAALPYGKWTCADGREVLFNRSYKPIWQRKDGVTARANPDEQVPFVKEDMFYNGGKPRKPRVLLQILTLFGVR